METSQIEQKLRDLISKSLGVKPDFDLNETFNELGADSLDAVELIMAIEDEFKIEVSDEEAQTLTTAAAVVESVKSKLS
jgi:acyl carrier protein